MKHKLALTDLADDFFEDTRLMGIVAPMRDYQFCWQLNNVLRFSFRNNTDIEILLHKKDRQYFFNVFEYCEPNSSLAHYLYNNHYDGEYLLPEFRHLDFLWLLKGDRVDDSKMKTLIEVIGSITGVQIVTELACEKIKNKGHLIF